VKASGNDFDVKADITIKDITKAIAFTVTINGNTATSDIKIDRTEFNIRYGSGSFFDGLGDNMIYDEFNLVVNLRFK
jgi:polyisoprenoid-binding protein YceI